MGQLLVLFFCALDHFTETLRVCQFLIDLHREHQIPGSGVVRVIILVTIARGDVHDGTVFDGSTLVGGKGAIFQPRLTF